MKKILALDIDSVLADLMPVWVERYNIDYNDNLTVKKIKDWDMSRFVKPECGKKIFDYLNDPNLYDYVNPIENAWEGVNALKKYFDRVIYVTAFHPMQGAKKFWWLNKFGFEVTTSDYIECTDKSLIKASYLIDDNSKNIKEFSGKGIIYSQPWNYGILGMRIKSWTEYLNRKKSDEIRVQMQGM